MIVRIALSSAAHIATWVIIGSCLLFSGPLHAQQTPTLKLGQSISGTAAAKGGDLYQFIGLAGTEFQAQLKLPGAGFLTLYSPDGEELTRIEGESNIELNAQLNENAMYFIGVIRKQPGTAYSLTLDGRIIEQANPLPKAAVTSASPEMPVVSASPAADPAVWGLYAHLLGQSRQAPGGYLVYWRWETPQEVLIEEWINPVSSKVIHTHTLRPGSTPGSLELDASYFGGDRSGEVIEDGSVDYQAKGFFHPAYRMHLSPNGDLEMQSVQIRDGITKVTSSQRFTVLNH